ncbi:MAG: hypothetical protein ACJAWY_003075 [Sphingomonas echinoides]|jgi:hypothetical protein
MDLRVHRAGPGGALHGRGDRIRFWLEIFGGITDEFRAAARRTEIISPPCMIGVMLRRNRIDGHPADWIATGWRWVIARVMHFAVDQIFLPSPCDRVQ